MSNEQTDYFSYLLRLWREKGSGQTAWRASLESSLTGELQVFASLSDLLEFLRQRTGVVLGAGDNDDETRT